jgi:hypothetical protein
LLQRLFHDFVPQHNNDYACVTKSLQLRVSPRFAAPRYDAYCKIWVKSKSLGHRSLLSCFPWQMHPTLLREFFIVFMEPSPRRGFHEERSQATRLSRIGGATRVVVG